MERKKERKKERKGFYQSYGIRTWLASALLFILVMTSAPAGYAMEYELGENSRLDMDVSLLYSISMRLEDPDNELLADINGDDGNRAFEKHDLISNRGTVRLEMDYQYMDYGVFARGRAFYDDPYNKSNAHNSPETHNNLMGGSVSDHQEFPDKTEEIHGKDVELLDLFVYGSFDVGERFANLRVGKQVVSWGESLVTFNSISAAQSHADSTKLNVPGWELKDIFLPSWQISGQIDVVNNLTFATYYQWDWEKNQLDAADSYFSTSDAYDDSGYHLLAAAGLPAAADRVADNEPDDEAQYGVALRYVAENLNDMEFGAYFINYHEKMPLLRTKPFAGTPAVPDWSAVVGEEMGATLNYVDNMGYYLDYDMNVRLYGASVSTVVGDTNIAGEVTYRDGMLIAVNDSNPGNILGFTYDKFDVIQVLGNFIHIFGPLGFIDNTTWTTEAGFNTVLDDENLAKDATAWGYTTKIAFDFFNVFPAIDLNVPIVFKQKVNGDSSVMGTWTEDENELSLALDFTYRQNLKFGFSYVNFLGDSDDYAKSDRDYVGFNTKYTF